MEESGSRCLRIGELVALVETGTSVADSNNHIDRCPHCRDLITALRAVLNKSLPEDIPAPSHCPNSDIDLLAQFLVFLQPSTSKDTDVDFFRHFNNCYACSEQFVENWNAYLATKENMGAS